MKGDVGFISDIGENFNSSFSPVIFDWLKPSFSYSSNYRWNKSRDKNIEGSNISSQLRLSSGVTLSPTRLVEVFYKPSTVRGASVQKPTRNIPSRSRRRTPGRIVTEEDQGIEESTENNKNSSKDNEKKKEVDDKWINGIENKMPEKDITVDGKITKRGYGSNCVSHFILRTEIILVTMKGVI